MDVDAKCRREGLRLNEDKCTCEHGGGRVKNWPNLANVFYGWLQKFELEGHHEYTCTQQADPICVSETSTFDN